MRQGKGAAKRSKTKILLAMEEMGGGGGKLATAGADGVLVACWGRGETRGIEDVAGGGGKD